MKALSTVICAFGAAFGLAFSASAGNVTLTWDASADPLPATLGDASTGLLEFTYENGLVKTLTATPVDGGTIVHGRYNRLCRELNKYNGYGW